MNSSGNREMTSSACDPIDPVDPNNAILCDIPSFQMIRIKYVFQGQGGSLYTISQNEDEDPKCIFHLNHLQWK